MNGMLSNTAAGLNRGMLMTADTLIGNPLAALFNAATGGQQKDPILNYMQSIGVGVGRGGMSPSIAKILERK